MDAFRTALPHAGLRAGGTRLALALGASVALHWLAGTHIPLHPGYEPGVPGTLPLSVTLLLPEVEELPAVPSSEGRIDSTAPSPATVVPSAPRVVSKRPQAATEGGPSASAVSSHAEPLPDRYYGAHELDVYPRPVTPLGSELANLYGRDHRALRLLVLLTLDQMGSVEEVVIVEGVLEGDLERDLRSTLRTTRFFPARKEGHPVKSRVVMSVEWNGAR